MFESKAWVGDEQVVESGSVLLGPNDDTFRVTVYDLTFSFFFVHDSHRQPVHTEPTGRNGMRVTLNTYQTTTPIFKSKVGFFAGNDLSLAIRAQSLENFRLITYTFTIKGR